MEVALIGIFAAFSLSMSLLVETSSWCLRVYASNGNIGTYIARTNIYLYGGRFFAILTQVLIGFLIDQGAESRIVGYIFLCGFILAAGAHAIVLGRRIARASLDSMLLRLMCLDIPRMINCTPRISKRLYLATAGTSTFFALGLMSPLALASLFPDYRLTLNNVGSLINFLGMILLLGYLDPMLYRALDKRILADKIENYIWGRVTGFVLCVPILVGLF